MKKVFYVALFITVCIVTFVHEQRKTAEMRRKLDLIYLKEEQP